MHTTANDRHWFQTAADKILFHTIMAGAQLPVPDLLAATQAGRSLAAVPCPSDQQGLAKLLR
jgi:glutathione synthase/RimK-type ligase-like ATP-grasp enzyme